MSRRKRNRGLLSEIESRLEKPMNAAESVSLLRRAVEELKRRRQEGRPPTVAIYVDETGETVAAAMSRDERLEARLVFVDFRASKAPTDETMAVIRMVDGTEATAWVSEIKITRKAFDPLAAVVTRQAEAEPAPEPA